MPNTIADNLQRLQTARTSIATAITNKGGTVASGAGFEDFPTAIAGIPSGGGSTGMADLMNRTITSFTIPSEATQIPLAFFQGCNNLTSINIPSTITKMETQCFKDCTGLTSATIALDNLIGTGVNNAFEGCTNLSTVNFTGAYKSGLSNTSKRLGSNMFRDCSRLTSAPIPTGCTGFAGGCFRGSGITNVVLPSTITYLDTGVFQGCSNLTTFDGSDTSLTTIPSSTFQSCSQLSNVSLPSTITSIGSNAFYYCSGLTSITLPSSITSINNTAFSYCTNLTTITINKPENSVSGAPWGATNATVVWTG